MRCVCRMTELPFVTRKTLLSVRRHESIRRQAGGQSNPNRTQTFVKQPPRFRQTQRGGIEQIIFCEDISELECLVSGGGSPPY